MPPDEASLEPPQISASIFRRAFERFQRIHRSASRTPLESFADLRSMAYDLEGYKDAIPDLAMAVMKPRQWKRRQIGTGEILAKVIEAIELDGNNLLQWQARHGPKSRVHLPLIQARSNSAVRRELEELFYRLYLQEQADETVFEALVARCGRRYELLAYLFFIAQPDRFLPIRTRSFDKAFAELGVSLRTAGQCDWANYQQFVAVLREVRKHLKDEGIMDATLLNAHSFCWILARNSGRTSNPGRRGPARLEMFSGTFEPAVTAQSTAPNEDARVRDMEEEAARRRASGMVAEEIALESERARLVAAGRQDLADRVEACGDRPGLGFDIMSFDEDGSRRCIEVKNVSNGRRFFLSAGEWASSRQRSNYWFYLVDERGPKIQQLPAAQLCAEHLQPVQYLVTYSASTA